MTMGGSGCGGCISYAASRVLDQVTVHEQHGTARPAVTSDIGPAQESEGAGRR